jgi:hypothetical protein
MFIRHAEKPTEGDCGVTAHTKLDTESLTPRAWQRNRSPSRVLRTAVNCKGRNGLMPDVIFAAGVGPGSKSARAADLMDRSDIALVAWEHKEVPSVIKSRLKRLPFLRFGPTIGSTWPGSRTDR